MGSWSRMNAGGQSKPAPLHSSITGKDGSVLKEVQVLSSPSRPAAKKRPKWITILDIMLLPGLLYLIINNYIPMAGLFIAFKNINYSKGIFASDWIGFKNFQYLFTTRDAFIITRNTLLYNIAFIILMTVIGVAVGIMLSEVQHKFMTKFYQTAILLPRLISIIIIANIVFAFLSNVDGLVNRTILPSLGLESISFYSETKYWIFILPAVYVWNHIGYTGVIYFAAVIGIDRDLYEAAYIDGANKRQQIFGVTLPLLKMTISTLVLLQVGRIFYSDFGLFYQVPMNAGALFNVTNTIDTYVYRGLMQMSNISMAAAAGAYQSMVGFITVVTVNYIVRKLDRESALF
jgi:putative aldouronate transport system permease protein